MPPANFLFPIAFRAKSLERADGGMSRDGRSPCRSDGRERMTPQRSFLPRQ